MTNAEWNSPRVLVKRAAATLVFIGMCISILLPLLVLATIYYALAKPAEWVEALGQRVGESRYGLWADRTVEVAGRRLQAWVCR